MRNKKQVITTSSNNLNENSPFSEFQSISKMSIKPQNMEPSAGTDNSMSDYSESHIPKEVCKEQQFLQINSSQKISRKSPTPQSYPRNTDPQFSNSLLSGNILSTSDNSPTHLQFTEPPPPLKSTHVEQHDRAYHSSRLDYPVPPPSCPPLPIAHRNPEHLYSVPPVDRLVGEFPDIPLEIYLKCLEVIKENPMGLNINDFKMAFERCNDNVPLNYTSYGYKNLKDCLSSMTNCLSINANSTNSFVVLPSTQFCEEWASQIRAKQKAFDKIKRKSFNETMDKDPSSQNTEDPNSKKSAFTSSDIRKYETAKSSLETPQVKYLR